MKYGTSNVLINFRVPETTRKLVRECAEYHNVTASFLYRFVLNEVLTRVEEMGLPPHLEREISLHHLYEQANAYVDDIKRIRYHAYLKGETMSYIARMERIDAGIEQDVDDPKFRVMQNFTDAVRQRYLELQRQLLAVLSAIEEIHETPKTDTNQRVQKTPI